MASTPPPSLVEIGPDGIARESPVIVYTEKIIEEEQLQLKRYIQENYSKIREVERELENLNLELKLTSGPKKAALEHLRKKIELSTERIRVAKLKEEQAKKDTKSIEQTHSVTTTGQTAQKQPEDSAGRIPENATAPAPNSSETVSDARNQPAGEVKEKKRIVNTGRGKGNINLTKGRRPPGSGWTGAGFDVDSGT